MAEGQTVLMRGRYSAALPACADGDHPKIHTDASGRILVSPSSTGALQNYDSGGDVTNLVVSANPGVLHSIYGYSSAAAAADRYIQLFDAAALPANGTVPDWVALLAFADLNFSMIFGHGVDFAVGIVIASSTTRATLTLTGAADIWVSGEFE